MSYRSRGRSRAGSVSPNSLPTIIARATFFAPLTSSLLLSKGTGSATFTRATTATVVDFEGNVKLCKAEEARFSGARRVENLAPAGSFSGTATVAGQVITYGANIGYAQKIALSGISIAGKSFNGSVVLSSSNKDSILLRIFDATTATIIYQKLVTLTNVPTRHFVYGAFVSGTGLNMTLENRAGIGGLVTTTAGSVTVDLDQVADVTGQSVQNIVEYVSSTENSTGALGVKYFETDYAGNPIPQATLKGYLAEGAATNLFLNSAVGVTQTTPALTAAPYTLSFKGTGSITSTGGFIGTLAGTGVANRVSLTVTASALAAVLTVTGSCTEVQFELGSFATSYIPTTTAAVTRDADVLTYPSAGNLSFSIGTAYADVYSTSSSYVGGRTQFFVGTNTGGRFLESDTDTNLRVIDSATNIGSITATGLAGRIAKIASSWGNGMHLTESGKTPSVKSAFAGMGAGIIGIGCTNTGFSQVGGNIRNVRLWTTQLTDSQLVTITS